MIARVCSQGRWCPLYTVAVIDDHPAMRLGIIAALKNVPDIQVVGEAGSGPELETLLEETVPNVLLLDISMPDFDVFLAVPRMQKQHPQMRIVIVTIHADETHVCRLIELGVDGYLVKEEPLPEYVKAIQTVVTGGTYFSQSIIPIAFGLNTRTSTPSLTPRELEVLSLLATGAKTDAIGEELYITPRTVTTHISNIYSKLAVNNRTAAVRKALELGLISVSPRVQ
jgi:DNA-binding NarL/FixJ family response regulator